MIETGISSRPARSFSRRDEPEHVRLVDVLQQREPAGEVAVERRVADRELRLVAGRDHEPAELVRERHQQRPADPRLQVLLGQVGLAPRERRRQRGAERLDDRLDRDLAEVDPERLGQPRASPRVASDEYRDGIETPCTRSAPSAPTAIAAVSAESIPPERPITTSPKPFFDT